MQQFTGAFSKMQIFFGIDEQTSRNWCICKVRNYVQKQKFKQIKSFPNSNNYVYCMVSTADHIRWHSTWQWNLVNKSGTGGEVSYYYQNLTKLETTRSVCRSPLKGRKKYEQLRELLRYIGTSQLTTKGKLRWTEQVTFSDDNDWIKCCRMTKINGTRQEQDKGHSENMADGVKQNIKYTKFWSE